MLRDIGLQAARNIANVTRRRCFLIVMLRRTRSQNIVHTTAGAKRPVLYPPQVFGYAEHARPMSRLHQTSCNLFTPLAANSAITASESSTKNSPQDRDPRSLSRDVH